MVEKLKLYLDQMLSVDVARALRAEGHDVIRASETGQNRSDDEQILQKAISENRILVTLDEHFGDWAVLPLSRHPGVIRLKVNPTTSERILTLPKWCPFSFLKDTSLFILTQSLQAILHITKS